MSSTKQTLYTEIYDLLKKHPATIDAYLYSVLNVLIDNETMFSYLSTIEIVKKEIKQNLTNTTKEGLLSSFSPNKVREDYLTLLIEEAKHQQKILSCGHIESHTLFLASLKLLDNKLHVYRKTLKEILDKNLHKLNDFSLQSPIIGRKKEIDELGRILRRTERNNALIIGNVGVGKTTLAKSLKHYLNHIQFFQLFPYSNLEPDQLVNMFSTTKTRTVFMLDEIFAFEAKTIKYLIDHFQIVGTANEGTYKKFSADFPHIVSKFEILNLNEPSEDVTLGILNNLSSKLSRAHSLQIADGVISELITLTKQYMQTQYFPAKGIMILEDAFSYVSSLHEKQVTVPHLKTVVSQKANVPISSLTELEKKDLSQLSDKLSMLVKGQPEAVNAVTKTIQRARLGLGNKNKPIGSFLFVGPSGVGKTELAKAIAKEVFGDTESMIRIDMSEFGEAHMVQRLIGSPPGYVGYEEGGQLTNPVKNKPYSLVLLDEIEKAHPRVFDIFLQVLDDGRLTDGQGNKVDFRNTIVVATSNAGIEEILDLIEEERPHAEMVQEIKDILEDYFRIEFINRFDGIILFNSLTPDALFEIASLQINKLAVELLKRRVTLRVKKETLQRLAKQAYNPRYGARGLLRLLQDSIESSVAEMILNNSLKDGDVVEF